MIVQEFLIEFDEVVKKVARKNKWPLDYARKHIAAVVAVLYKKK